MCDKFPWCSEVIALQYLWSHSVALFVLFTVLFNLDAIFWLEDSRMFNCVENEDNYEEGIANAEEIETNLQEADFETPETMAVDEEEMEESLPLKQKLKIWMK